MGTLGEDHGEATAITTVTIPEVNPELLPSDRPAAQVGESSNVLQLRRWRFEINNPGFGL